MLSLMDISLQVSVGCGIVLLNILLNDPILSDGSVMAQS